MDIRETHHHEKLNFEIFIDASLTKVWQVLWNDTTYRRWTATFSNGSYAVSDWKEGSKIHFLTPAGDGMFSVISVCNPKKQMTFTHLGEIKGFAEQGESEWSGMEETYKLSEENKRVKLLIELDSSPEFKEYFAGVFPKALQMVKILAENVVELTVEVEINATVNKVWKMWTTPEDICKWNNASEDWHTTRAENDLRSGGSFLSRMEAKDGCFGFDFTGSHIEVTDGKLIASVMSDGRKMNVTFISDGNKTKVIETFEAENENTLDLQQAGWQAILNSFKKYAESN